MKNTVANYSVRGLDGMELLAAGETCTPARLNAILVKVPMRSIRAVPLMSQGRVQKDFYDLLSSPPYDVIFAQQSIQAEIVSMVQDIEVPYTMISVMDYFREKDFYTYRHMLAIYGLSILLAWELDPSNLRRLHEAGAGPSHDMGKVDVPIEILTKRSPLTREERGQLEHHALAGYVHLIGAFQDKGNHAALLARDHHERLDGSGYPRRIVQQDIFVEAVTVADIFDALVSPRHYRSRSYDVRSAIEIITDLAEEGSLSWASVKALIAFNRTSKPNATDVRVSRLKRGTVPEDNSYGVIADSDPTENS